MESVERSAFEEFHGDQLVVDLPHKALVRERLEKLGVKLDHAHGTSGIKADKELALALFDLERDSLRATADGLRGDQAFMDEFLDTQPVVYRRLRLTPQVPDLELLLFRLRQIFACQFDGWSPAMDKNHLASAIEGTPGISGGHASGGAEGPPVQASEAGYAIASATYSVEAAQISIGLLDTPFYEGNAIFKNALTRATDRLVLDGTLLPQSAGHATFVGGMIMARAREATLIVRAVLSRDAATAALWDTAQAMVDLGRKRVDLINMSWTYATTDVAPSLILDRAIAKVRELSPHVVLVAAAGNHGSPEEGDRPDCYDRSTREVPNTRSATGDRIPLPPNRPVFPAATPGVIAVGAFAKDPHPGGLAPAPFSPQPAPWISLGAPGEHVVSTYIKGLVHTSAMDEQGSVQEQDVSFSSDFASWSGTSFATGFVTGEIARLMGANGWTAQATVRKLQEGISGNAVQPYSR
jgi:subtilisin family serine protease